MPLCPKVPPIRRDDRDPTRDPPRPPESDEWSRPAGRSRSKRRQHRRRRHRRRPRRRRQHGGSAARTAARRRRPRSKTRSALGVVHDLQELSARPVRVWCATASRPRAGGGTPWRAMPAAGRGEHCHLRAGAREGARCGEPAGGRRSSSSRRECRPRELEGWDGVRRVPHRLAAAWRTADERRRPRQACAEKQQLAPSRAPSRAPACEHTAPTPANARAR